MPKQKIISAGGLVYSTDPNFKLLDNELEIQETALPNLQKLRIILDKKTKSR